MLVALVLVVILLFSMDFEVSRLHEHNADVGGAVQGKLPRTDSSCRPRHVSEAAVIRAETALRNMRRLLTRFAAFKFTGSSVKNKDVHAGGVQACGASARRARGTRGWGARGAALWGVLPLPLSRAAPAPQVLLQPSPPRHADCWPFRGSTGEVLIDLSRPTRVTVLSIEHVRPDTARSAPKRFTLYGVLVNGTQLRGYSGEYRSDSTPRQLFPSRLPAQVKAVALRVLSNHGNPRYTCLYRVQLYSPLPR